MGYFMTAYDFFNPVRSLAVAGIPVAVSKMVSEAVATGRFADTRRTFRAALGLMCITGVLGTVGVFAFGELFADLAGNPGASAASSFHCPGDLLLLYDFGLPGIL